MRNGLLGGEIGARTPVESRENRAAGIVNDVVVPVLLAMSMTLAVMLTWLAFIFALRTLKDETFWLISVIGSGSLFAVIPIRRRMDRTPEEATVGTIAAGLLFVLLGAYFSNALWQVASALTPTQILISAPVVGLPFGLIWLGISTFQESLFRSPFVEQSAGQLISSPDEPWHQKPERHQFVAEPQTVRVELVGPEPGQFGDLDMPLSEGKAIWLGRHIVSGGSFSVAACTGIDRPMSRGDFETLRDWLVERGFAVWINKDKPNLGVTVVSKGRALFSALAEL